MYPIRIKITLLQIYLISYYFKIVLVIKTVRTLYVHVCPYKAGLQVGSLNIFFIVYKLWQQKSLVNIFHYFYAILCITGKRYCIRASALKNVYECLKLPKYHFGIGLREEKGKM